MTVGRPKRIPEVRYVGTTWYERDWHYWILRIGLSMARLFFTVIILCIAGVFVYAMLSLVSSPTGKVVVAMLCAVPIIGSFWSAYIQLRRTPEERAAHLPLNFRERDDLPVAGVAGIGIVAAGGAAIMGFFLALSSLFVVGHIVGTFVSSLGRYLTVREWEAARAYGLDPELPDQSDEFREAHPLVPRFILLGDY